MNFPGQPKESGLWRYGWHYVLVLLIVAAVIFRATTVFFLEADLEKVAAFFEGLSTYVFAGALLAALFGVLVLLYELVRTNRQTCEKLETAVEMLNRNRSLLGRIAQAVQLSDSAKETAFRDNIRMELAEAVLSKLHQHAYDEAEVMIEAMSGKAEFKSLTEQLKKASEKFRNATEEQRVEQIIAHIDVLCSDNLWEQANAQIETLLKSFPYSEKARVMPQKLQQRKDKKKKGLLAAWDQAVISKETDKSLEILKELDAYLTPSEGLALQESASTVFKTKLHNLGVQFSLAITEMNWSVALQTAREIVSNFPNSRMAHEIISKMDILQERAGQTQPQSEE